MNAVERTLYSQLLLGICEEMGQVLMLSAHSPNIKERRDFSAAIFDAHGRLAAQGNNIPVHLGSMPASVAAAVAELGGRLGPGDVAVLNDPYSGGTHLPDITVVAPFTLPGASAPSAYLANRAHHADVGGMSGGSLPLSRELLQEGLVLPPVLLVRGGVVQDDIVRIIMRNSRTPEERFGDLQAQLAALRRGAQRLADSTAAPRLDWVFGELMDYAAKGALEFVRGMPRGTGRASVLLETDGQPARIAAAVGRQGDKLVCDFSGSSAQIDGPLNAVRSITLSASLYVLRCLIGPELPVNDGILRCIELVTQPGTIVDALSPAAVAGGNVETSQRIVDCLLLAMSELLPERIPACSQGTMNNITISGNDSRSGAVRPFAYYETIAGGHGGGPGHHGLSARHCHMTNSLNTPIEALEAAYPLRVLRCSIRRGSGGRGGRCGGDGVLREYELLADADLNLLTQHRLSGAEPLAGGDAGKTGRNTLIRNGRSARLGPLACVQGRPGDIIRIETPGGGGWGQRG